jgi:DNA modification methylase
MKLKRNQIPQHLLKFFQPVHKQWIARNDVIWAKRNGMPESVTDRFSKKHEYFFFMVKSEKYFFDLDAIRKPLTQSSIQRLSQDIESHNGSERVPGKSNGNMKARVKTKIPVDGCEQYGSPRARNNRENGSVSEGCFMGSNPGSVSDFWDIPTKPSKEKHYASYNDSLLVKPVLAGCPEGGIIYDPFMGTGSTAEVAIRSKRNFIGSEMSAEYCDIANKRLISFLNSPTLF